MPKTGSPTDKRRGAYGFDAPPAIFGIACGAVGAIVWTIGFWLVLRPAVAVVPLVVAVVMIAMLVLFLHSTRRGKFLVWREVLDGLGLSGAERVLELGCGRGAVLMMTAKRLATGRAVGVDLWRTADQSGNSEAVTIRNAEAEGVRDRVEIRTGDMTELPFGDGEFDLVLSSLAIHNIKGAEGRDRAIEQAFRVLRPGGRLAIVDLAHVGQYQRRLTELGGTDVRVRPLGWRMWWGGPWVSSRLLTATKPA